MKWPKRTNKIMI